MIDLWNKRVVVMGLGKSGLAAAKLLNSLGCQLKISELRQEDEVKDALSGLNYIASEFGGHSQGFITDADLVVISPGIHLDMPEIEAVKRANIPIISEIELGYQAINGQKIVAVTGTNGKTTTTTLIGEILKTAGQRVVLAGNIGLPLCQAINDGLVSQETIIVLELSSFQLETISRFKADVSVLLNLTTDHLDHHQSFADYLRAKRRIFERQRSSDFMVLNMDDLAVMGLSKLAQAKPVCFSLEQRIKNGVWLEDGQIKADFDNLQMDICQIDQLRIKGSHNVANAMAAIGVALILKVEMDALTKALQDFEGVEHRLERVAELSGVSFINDSKSTNVDSVLWALRSFDQPLILIAGGRDKGGDYSRWNHLLKERGRAVILLGEAASKIEQGIRFSDISRVKTLTEAVRLASKKAKKGDIVLFSPGCSSFDMFTNYEERGRAFKQEVQTLCRKAKKR